MSDRGHGPSPSAFARNLAEYPASPGRKALLLVRNLGLRVVKLQECCGHPGEPGC
ncbi:MAG TPA: hypothetical protein VFA46_03910 [Actinomycetes bacterium]|jgi:hypothetical protein|nr:hypothetical protein [Actinomycetes bacterium]